MPIFSHDVVSRNLRSPLSQENKASMYWVRRHTCGGVALLSFGSYSGLVVAFLASHHPLVKTKSVAEFLVAVPTLVDSTAPARDLTPPNTGGLHDNFAIVLEAQHPTAQSRWHITTRPVATSRRSSLLSSKHERAVPLRGDQQTRLSLPSRGVRSQSRDESQPYTKGSAAQARWPPSIVQPPP